MIRRTLGKKLREAAGQFPVVTVTGPRQSGKTTLVRAVFENHTYASLELPDQRDFANEDPRGFLDHLRSPVILDEVQRTPDLFSYIQTLVDETNRPGQYILTGSHNFLLMERISQSLAGRCAVLHLLPFSLAELSGRAALSLETLGRGVPRRKKKPQRSLEDVLYAGFYPRIHAKNLEPRDWLGSYYQTYLERDVRNVLKIGDLEAFGRFIRLCAGRNGQLLNTAGLASDCGVTHTTVRRWISVLEASFIITLLRPHHRNFGKRLVKSPKLYFLDSGLLCFLLRIRSPEDLYSHASRGAVFESFILSEFHKNFVHRGEQPPLFFWRDSGGHEIDILIDMGTHLIPVEVKSARTVVGDFFDGLRYWLDLGDGEGQPAALIYGGDQPLKRKGVTVYPWFLL